MESLGHFSYIFSRRCVGGCVASEKKQRFENLTKGYYLLVKRYTTVFERMTLAITQNENEEYETNNIYNVMTARDSLCKYISDTIKCSLVSYIEYILWTPRSRYSICIYTVEGPL